MSNWPEHVEPLDRAILDLLCTIPPRWTEIAYDDLTSSEKEKLRLKLEAAGRADMQKAITFEFSHFLSPHSCYAQAQGLFARYCEHFGLDGGDGNG